MSPSPEAIAISDPLAIVADLYAQNQKQARGTTSEVDNFFYTVSQHFQTVLRDHVDDIPILDNVSERGKLVRFRCMVQDTGMANEVYVLDVDEKSSKHGSPSRYDGRGCCAYSEGAASGSPIIGYDADNLTNLCERQVVYAVSVPGETSWSRKSHTRRRSSISNAVEGITRSLQQSNITSNGTTPAITSHLAYKYPFPAEKHTGAIIKLYPYSATAIPAKDAKVDKPASTGGTSSLKATEIVEFVGILDYSHLPAEDHEAIPTTPAQPVKTLHAICSIPAPVDNEDIDKDATVTREALVNYIATGLEGDLQAAEFLLLALLGRVNARRGSITLGHMPMNLVLPASSPLSTVKTLADVLSTLVARLVTLDLSIPALNASRYAPTSQNEDLHSGCLQLPAGTCVLVDETRLGEGTLKDAGVRNIQALTNVLQNQTLQYNFPFSSFTFETDLKLIVISCGKSLLPVECVIQVQPGTTQSTIQTSPEQMQSFRQLLSFERTQTFSIPEKTSEYIQADFVKTRQADAKAVSQEDLVRRMTLARLLAVSLGEKELTEVLWDQTRQLDEARQSRLGL